MSTKVEHALELQHVKRRSSRLFIRYISSKEAGLACRYKNPITNQIANLNTSFVTSLNTS